MERRGVWLTVVYIYEIYRNEVTVDTCSGGEEQADRSGGAGGDSWVR